MKTFVLLLALAQQSNQPYVETVEVRINNVDVVVTDRAGKPVTGLRKEDFLVLEDGKPQPLTNFSESVESKGVAALQKPTGNATPPPAEQTQRAPRHFIFFADEMSLHPTTRTKMLRDAKALVATAMQPGDEAMIYRPQAKEKIALPFTSDHAAIDAALTTLVHSFDTRVDTEQSLESFRLASEMSKSVAQERKLIIRDYAHTVRNRVTRRLGQLRSVIGSMAGISGRKILVLMASSFPSQPGKDVVDQMWNYQLWGPPQVGIDYYDLTPEIDEAARIASANGVTIYGLQPTFNLSDAIGGPDIVSVRNNVGMQAVNFASQLNQNERSFSALADVTGGRFFRGDGNVTAAFHQVSNDLSAYYSLGYRAPETDVGKVHRVEVKVKDRPELQVRARRDVMRKSPTQELEDQTIASLIRPGGNELAIGVEVGEMTRDEDDLVLVPLIVHVPLKSLTFLRTEEGRRATFRIQYAASGERSTFESGFEREQDVDVPEDELESTRDQYFTYDTNLRLKPGKYRVAIGMIDTASRVTGFLTVEVDAK
ncbi:MAG: VWA domain-containing protein [Acidobacteria bacterium]|nr:VWA domain-containing protein [Acidobacteriota bacterium]